MMNEQHRTLLAAQRIADAWSKGAVPPARTLHATAWILGRANSTAPAPVDPVSASLVELTLAAAQGDLAKARAVVTRGFEASLAEGSTLLQGLAALGSTTAEASLDLALAHPEAAIGGAMIAAGLMRAAPHRADEWLDRMRLAPSRLRLLEAVIEILLAARDLGAPHARAEAAWLDLETTSVADSGIWWDGRLRMVSRESPPLAAEELLDATALVGAGSLPAGPFTLVRWARADSAAAARFVAENAPRMRVWGRWARGLTFDGALPEAAREGWTKAVSSLAPDDLAEAGQLYAVAARIGDPARIDEVLSRVSLPPGDRVDLASVGVRMLAREAPDRASALLEALRAGLADEDHPGGLLDELAVFTDVTFDVPWWSTFLPDPP